MHLLKLIGKATFVLLAVIGLTFVGVYIAMKLGLTNVRGTIAERNNSFLRNIKEEKDVNEESEKVVQCRIHALAEYAPDTARHIEIAYERNGDKILIAHMFENALLRYSGTPLGSIFTDCANVTVSDERPIPHTAYQWADSDEWEVLRSAFSRDQDTIKRAAKDAGISPRILLGGIIGEQLRFFSNRRESFKSYFEPLKILATLSNFSYGIAGLKPETVARIDENLKNRGSVFYLGPSMENVITYPEGADKEKLRFERITDTKNTYYSYLYAGLFMRQVIAQWHSSGYEISDQPGVISTLYNLGFNRSVPKTNARPGGAVIFVNGEEYSFGELGEQFYYSGEMIQEFPY